MIEMSEVLFIGIGKSAVLWYRAALPAHHLGADWVGVRGEPPDLQVMTGIVKGDTALPVFGDYKVIVIQQPFGHAWLKQIRSLQARGIKVLYEIDDYIHSVGKQREHDYARFYDKARVAQHELCMRICDGMIVSTDYLARRYAKFNRRIYVCRNGIDLARYRLTRPERPTVNIGWAGATGHMRELIPWLNEAVIPVMHAYDNTCAVIVGQPGMANPIGQLFEDRTRAIGVPFTTLECYPAAMCLFDIALAPAGSTAWYRGKSDLRWLEASALKIPTIADPVVYPEIEHGVTGFHAGSPDEARVVLDALVSDKILRERVGQNAFDYICEYRSSDMAALQWSEVLTAVEGEYESIYQLERN